VAAMTVAATPATAALATTITPNPAYAGAPFQGWGNSLVWFANATGGYPDALRDELYEMVFGEDGLDMNVARYNIGGGRASDVGNYFRLGADVDGYWAADDSTDADSLYGTATTDFADKDALAAAWDPDDEASYDWSQDSTQRWWLEKLATERDDLVLEGFANSPPWFMTNSGYTSGGASSTTEQVSTANDVPTKYTKYLATVVKHLEDTYGVHFQSVDPFNEPCTGYWSTPTGRLADGITPYTTAVKKPQEGAQICPGTGAGQQQNLVALLHQALAGTDTVVSANDETNPGNFNTAWSQYDAATRADVDQVNVHSYGTNGILQARDTAITADKTLWMSETGGDFVGSGFDPVNISGGLGIAQKISDDLRQLQPDAYVLWQEVEDYYNMQKGEKLNWGSIFIDFDCTYVDASGAVVDQDDAIGFKSKRRVADALAAGDPVSSVADCSIVTNSKFDAMRNFMQYIHAGDRIVPTDDTASTAAIDASGTGMNLVHTNASTQAQTVTLDLKNFGDIAAGATVTPVVTTQAADVDDTSTALVEGTAVAVDRTQRTATLTVPARSVTTFVVTGVSGVAAAANPLVDGGTYQAVGVQSGKALAKSAAGALVIDNLATTAAALPAQQWVAHETTPAGTSTARRSFVLENAGDGSYLGATSAGTEFRDVSQAEAAAQPATTWYLTTMDGTTWTLVNGATASSLDVGGQSTTAGATVGIYGTNGGANQRFTFRSATASSPTVAPLSLRTTVGTAAALPSTVVPTYTWGAGVATPVTWNVPAGTWDAAGSVVVTGTGTDIYGNTITVRATVDVGDVAATDPTSVTVVAGSSLGLVRRAAPTTVATQVGTSETRFDLPVTWDFSGVDASAFASPGVVAVPGTVAAADTGTSDVAAVLHVIVTAAGTTQNVALTSTPSATFTESSSYAATRTINGDRTDKGWSNWRSGTKNTSDTLTYVLKDEGILDEARIYFYKDGSSLTWPTTITTQYRDADTGAWTTLPTTTTLTDSTTDPAPVATIDLGGVAADAVRFVLAARPATHMIVSETEIDAVTPSASSVSSLARLTVGGTDVDGFDPATTHYSVQRRGSEPVVTAVPTDASATVSVERDGASATVTVTAVDGTTTTYTVDLDLQVDLGVVRVTGSPVAGQLLTASATTDPADAAVTFRWTVGGTTVGTGATYRPSLADAGKAVAVTATATAPGFRSAQGTSDPVTVLDGRVASKVTLSTSPTTQVAGKPVTLTARVTSSAQSAVTGGSVAFRDGSVVLGRASVGSDGVARFTIAKPTAGTHVLAADFTPAAGSATVVAPSASSSVKLVVTTPVVGSTTKVSVSPSKATTKTKPVVTATVRAAGKPVSGSVTVTVKRGSTTVRTTTARLTGGSARVTLPAQSAPGSYTVTARYAGTTGVAASSATAKLTVVRATSLKAKVSPRTVTTRTKAKVSLTATASPKATVSGKVTVKVYKGKRVVATKTVSLSRSHATVTLPRLAKGTYTVKATYAGSSSAAPATAKAVTVKVKR